ncbi:MAG: CHAT domain-containing protein [Bradyrhizobium sp.]|nr:CHAT domain-containing protein [Bradyrhizobium sp.]
MFDWIDESGWATAWADSSALRRLEIQVGAVENDAAAVLLDAPWELLAREHGHLSVDDRMLQVVRRIGVPVGPLEPAHGDIRVMFMAAAPVGQTDLNYEAEEADIVAAAGARQRLKLVVEETGSITELSHRLTSSEGPFEALHLSCHGDILSEHGPVLLLESPVGDADEVAPGDLARALGERKPPLVVLSACRTAERGSAGARGSPPGDASGDANTRTPNLRRELASPYARQLVMMVANVVGWGGSVYDRDAIDFAAAFYEELSKGATIPYAAAVARQVLLRLNVQDPERGRHWHLARVYAGPCGGGALCASDKPVRPAKAVAREFLDAARQEVPVASRERFVGRRRPIQTILRVFRDGGNVLVHGMGALGKSSVAARVAERTSLRPIVVFRRYDALAIFDRVEEAIDPQPRLIWRQIWREQVKANEARLGEALEDCLSTALREKPILLIIDDLEEILEAPSPGGGTTSVKQDYRAALTGVIGGFTRAQEATGCASRLLLTSRYDFRLPDGMGGDVATSLQRVHLRSMDGRERQKQLHATEYSLARYGVVLRKEDHTLVGRAVATAAGNPGLQDVLTRPILAGQQGEAETAIEQVEAFRRTGVLPLELQASIDAGPEGDQENRLAKFFERMAFATYRRALSNDDARMLAGATIFTEGIPVPIPALVAGGASNGTGEPGKAVERLLGLGLFDDWGVLNGHKHAAANALARPLVAASIKVDRSRLARAVTPHLVAAWSNKEGTFVSDARSIDAAWLTIAAEAPTTVVESSALAAASYLVYTRHNAPQAHPLVCAAIEFIVNRGGTPTPDLLLIAIDVADQLGEVEALRRHLEIAESLRGETDRAAGSLLLRKARIALQEGRLDESIEHARNAERVFLSLGSARDRAIAISEISNVLEMRGDLDEALRIRRHEVLPIYEASGDVRHYAVTLDEISDILETRGDLDEALRIRLEEVLPVFEKLGQVRSRAVTLDKIADIFEVRGDLDEALRIRREEELPALERLGDIRGHAAVMGKIANILRGRGEVVEALRIWREEVRPVYERLGDVRLHAIATGNIADGLQAQGDLNEADRIRREEELPVYEKLGDVRERATTMDKIADVLELRGKVDEALRIRHEQVLPAYEQVGYVRGRAITLRAIAHTLQARGELDEALRTLREEVLPIFDRLRDVRERAMTMVAIADMLELRGNLDEALRIRREELLPVFKRLGDVHSCAGTMRQIANTMIARGELDAVLRILSEEVLPIYTRLGNVQDRAGTMADIAHVRLMRGESSEALRILREEVLPVYDHQGDVRNRAAAMGKIADVLEARGELEEALQIHRQEVLPVYERLGDVRRRAMTLDHIADVLEAQGKAGEALRMRRDEVLPLFEGLGDVRARALTMGKIADVMLARGELDGVLRICREELLPVYAQLGDVRSRAITMSKIADIFQARGEFKEAVRIYREEVLPIFEQLGDARSKSFGLYRLANVLIAAVGLDDHRVNEIHSLLAEAFSIARDLQQTEGVAYIGNQLMQVLAELGDRQAVLQILDEVEKAFRKLKDATGLETVRQIGRWAGR